MPIQRDPRPLPSLEETQLESERLKQVQMLLDNLFRREEATLKQVIDCLYDVGSLHLINQKIPIKRLRGPLRTISRLSKPAFRLLAVRRLQKTAPELLTQWLYAQATRQPFQVVEEESTPLIDVIPDRAELPPVSLPPIVERQAAEINLLRNQVTRLVALLVMVMVAALGGMMFLS